MTKSPKDVFGAIIDAQPSPISNTGSPCSSNSDSVVCPSPAAGNGLAGARSPARSPAGPNASFEFLAREMATQFARQNEQFSVVQSSMADMQRQLRELSITTALTMEWMRSFETRSGDIDKTLDPLRERLDALQLASVSSMETKSIVSD